MNVSGQGLITLIYTTTRYPGPRVKKLPLVFAQAHPHAAKASGGGVTLETGRNSNTDSLDRLKFATNCLRTRMFVLLSSAW